MKQYPFVLSWFPPVRLPLRILSGTAAIFLMVIALMGHPMVLIYSLIITIILFRRQLRSIAPTLPPVIRFLVAGILFGLITETCAIFENLNKPAAERILLHPEPWKDLIYGFFYYCAVIGALLAPLAYWRLKAMSVFLVVGMYGICVEQSGAIVKNIIANPLSGIPMALLIMGVYGIFPAAAYLVSNFDSHTSRRPVILWHYPLVCFLLFLQWALYGNVILPLLKKFI